MYNLSDVDLIGPLAQLSDVIGWLTKGWHLLLLLLGFSLVIFVHELGHYLAAKWARVRVDRFAIGFGRSIVSYRKGIGWRFGSTESEYSRRVEGYLRGSGLAYASNAESGEPASASAVEGSGNEPATSVYSETDRIRAADALGLGETEYCLNILPLGGYVKMMGQEDFVIDKSGELKVRDNIDSFTNKPVGKRMVIVSAGVIMNLIFAAIAFTVVVMLGLATPPAVVGNTIPNSPADLAGLQPGDRITAVNGRTVRSFNDLMSSVVLSDQEETLILDVIRDGKSVEPRPRILPKFDKDRRVRLMGVQGGFNRRVAIAGLALSETPAPHDLQPMDQIVGYVENGQQHEVKNIGGYLRKLIELRGRPIETIVSRPKRPESLTGDELSAFDPDIESEEVHVQVRATWAPAADEVNQFGQMALLGLVPRLTVIGTDEGKSFEKAGVQRGDVIVSLGDVQHPTYDDLKAEIEQNPGKEFPVRVSRFLKANHGLSGPSIAFLTRNREAIIAAAKQDLSTAMDLAQTRAAEAGLADDERSKLQAKLAEFTGFAALREWLDNAEVHTLGSVRPKAPFAIFSNPLPPIDVAALSIDEGRVLVAGVLEKVAGRETPAHAAGIPAGATIVSAAGQPVESWNDLSETCRMNTGRTIEVTYRVGEESHSVQIAVPRCVTAALNLPQDTRITRINGKTSAKIEEKASGKDGKATLEETPLPDWRVVRALLSESVGQTVAVEYQTPDGQTLSAKYTVPEDGVDPWLQRVRYTPVFQCYPLLERNPIPNPITAAAVGFEQAYQETVNTIDSIRHMVFTRQVGVNNVSGPLGIIALGSRVAGAGVLHLVWFLGVISANLAVINFLPLPIVDGGLFVFLILEKIRGEPVSIKMQVATQMIGVALIITLFVLVTYQDILRIFA